jgi:hypothetical protein
MFRLRCASHFTIAAAVTIVACRSQAPEPETRAQYVHDHIAAIIARSATRSIVVGDTFVGWWPNPVLYNTVHRSGDTVESSLVRVDSLVGTARSVWSQGRQRKVSVLWTQRDSTLLQFEAVSDTQILHITSPRDTMLDTPATPWAIADYGMDDQLLPLIQELARHPGAQRIAIFHPFANKWDTVTVIPRSAKRALVVDIANGPGDIDHWIITHDGALVRVTRDKYPNLERRPLELTARMVDYLKFKSLMDSGQAPK